MNGDRDLRRRLRALRAPSEAEAEDRSWNVVRAAYAERTPAGTTRRAHRLTLAVAVGVALIAIGLSPAGAKVADLVRDVVGVGEQNARPQLRALPAAGELLVESPDGPWIVRADGSKRLLGQYGDATWSPHGLFVAAADGRELVAVDPFGNVRWTITAPARVADPRWSPSGFRIAYRSGDDLRVVAGDGTGDRPLARGVSPVAPAWRPIGDSKLAAAPGAPGSNTLTFVDRVDGAKTVSTIDVDTGAALQTKPADLEQLSTPPTGGGARIAISPDAAKTATLQRLGRRDELLLEREAGGGKRVLFSAAGRLTGPTWSPDGRWLLVGWPDADQWLFIAADRPHRVVAFDRISEQFDPGGSGGGRFPRVAGWVLPER